MLESLKIVWKLVGDHEPPDDLSEASALVVGRQLTVRLSVKLPVA